MDELVQQYGGAKIFCTSSPPPLKLTRHTCGSMAEKWILKTALDRCLFAGIHEHKLTEILTCLGLRNRRVMSDDLTLPSL